MGPEACPRGQGKGALESLTLEEVVPFASSYRITTIKTTSFGHGSSEFLKLAALLFKTFSKSIHTSWQPLKLHFFLLKICREKQTIHCFQKLKFEMRFYCLTHSGFEPTVSSRLASDSQSTACFILLSAGIIYMCCCFF